MSYKYNYLIKLQYLGYRLHGWQKQPNVKTVHSILDKTLKFICKDIRFKSMGVGRTDAKVSSTDYLFELFIDSEVKEHSFIKSFNLNSPSDVRVLNLKAIKSNTFNLIQHPKEKEYRYYFSFGEKNHPYSAPFMHGYMQKLNLEKMIKAARYFEGHHNFKRYCTKPTEHTQLEREINSCIIVENTFMTASFFPEKSYVLIVKGRGFLRNQIRLIMGAIAEVGKGNYTLDFIKDSLDPTSDINFLKTIAPASGLHLHKIELKDDPTV